MKIIDFSIDLDEVLLIDYDCKKDLFIICFKDDEEIYVDSKIAKKIYHALRKAKIKGWSTAVDFD